MWWPKRCKVLRFSWVAGWAYIWTFMAGARTTGARVVTRSRVESRSSASPCASLARILAVCRRNKHKVGAIRQPDMADFGFLGQVKRIG